MKLKLSTKDHSTDFVWQACCSVCSCRGNDKQAEGLAPLALVQHSVFKRQRLLMTGLVSVRIKTGTAQTVLRKDAWLQTGDHKRGRRHTHTPSLSRTQTNQLTKPATSSNRKHHEQQEERAGKSASAAGLLVRLGFAFTGAFALGVSPAFTLLLGRKTQGNPEKRVIGIILNCFLQDRVEHGSDQVISTQSC